MIFRTYDGTAGMDMDGDTPCIYGVQVYGLAFSASTATYPGRILALHYIAGFATPSHLNPSVTVVA